MQLGYRARFISDGVVVAAVSKFTNECEKWTASGKYSNCIGWILVNNRVKSWIMCFLQYTQHHKKYFIA